MRWTNLLLVVIAVLLLSLAATTRIIRDYTSQMSAANSAVVSRSTQKMSYEHHQRRRTTSENADDEPPPAEEGRSNGEVPAATTTSNRIIMTSSQQQSSTIKKHQLAPPSSPPAGAAAATVAYARGRDTERGHAGLSAHPDTGVNHAWGVDEEDETIKCHGTHELPDCSTREAYEWAAKHILFVIITGAAATFRVEVSQCTWLAKLPADNVYVVTDVLPAQLRTPHHWLQAHLPDGMENRNGDFFSKYMPKGYLHAVRRAGQGYGAGWIAAQTRFTYGLKYAAAVAQQQQQHHNTSSQHQHHDHHHHHQPPRQDIKWVLLMDDDTIVQLDHLVQRVRTIDERSHPWYFSRMGWGGAGHLYSRRAVDVLHARLHECVDKWFIRQFRASDAMLLKCAGHLKLRTQMERTMSHCPAASGPHNIESPHQVTMHGKKDYYPPILLATWRVSLYYLSLYCRSPKAIHDVVEWSACTYGSSCKRAGCDKVVDRRRDEKWIAFSNNGTLRQLPMAPYVEEIRVPTR